MPPKSPHDWEALKAEFISTPSTLTLCQFLKNKGVGSNAWAYRHANKHKWKEAKEAVIQEAMRKVAKGAVNKWATEWDRQMKLWGAVESQAALILRKTIGPDGDVVKPLTPVELAALAKAVDTALKGQKLIMGEATERSENKNLNLCMDIMDAIAERDKKHGIDSFPA